MWSMPVFLLSPVRLRELSPRMAPLSTHLATPTHLRDIDSVSHASVSGYLTTGVETRSLLECAPTLAGPAVETEPRVSHRTVTQSRTNPSTFVSRLS